MQQSLTLSYDGQINLILGSMFSGKTSELVRRYNRHTIGGRKCLMIKYKKDTRYDDESVVTHDKIKIKAFVCEYLYEADMEIESYDVICIDELQFYKDAYIMCDNWANRGKIIEACGLNGTFNRTPFEVISKILPLAENITFLKAVCKNNGNDAVYSNINIQVNDNTTEIIGGDEKYDAVDRKTFFKNKQFPSKDQITEFTNIYLSSKNNQPNHISNYSILKMISNNHDTQLSEDD
jgi:thymidine kinase